MTFPVPESLNQYFRDQAVRNAVEALVDALDGKNMPATGWDEARNYNQALLMAAQVRADFVDLLFRVWDATFGRANSAQLGEGYFTQIERRQEGTPAAIWKNQYVEHYYYRDSRPADEDGRNDGLFVWLVPSTKTIALGVERYSEGGDMPDLPRNAADGLKGWSIETNVQRNISSTYFSNQPVDITEFLDNPCPVVDRFRRDAVEIVTFLART